MKSRKFNIYIVMSGDYMGYHMS